MAVDFPKRVVHGGLGKLQQEKTKETVLDFSASVNPFPPTIGWHRDSVDLTTYPDDTYCTIKERIGSVYSREPEEICVGNGSIEVLRAFCSVVFRRGSGRRTFFTESPTFAEYELSAQLVGAVRCDLPDEADVRFICNPNNPDGNLLGRADILRIIQGRKDRPGFLFCDEAFIHLADTVESVTDIREPHLFVLHSLTKSFAVPGLRIGFGFGDPELVDKIETARSPWCLNAYAESFAMEALLHMDELEESRKKIQQERQRLRAGLNKLGLICQPSSANYLLANYGSDVKTLCSELTKRNILVRDCTSFGLPTCIRIGVRRPEENRLILEAIDECVR